VTYEGVPGLVESVEAHGETTLVVDPARVVEAAQHLRDAEGFDFLSDLAAADYLGWGGDGVSGYIGTAARRDHKPPMTRGFHALPKPKPKRVAVN
jgi:NADH:ubiquinone oxidoreductase subunit C